LKPSSGGEQEAGQATRNFFDHSQTGIRTQLTSFCGARFILVALKANGNKTLLIDLLFHMAQLISRNITENHNTGKATSFQ